MCLSPSTTTGPSISTSEISPVIPIAAAFSWQPNMSGSESRNAARQRSTFSSRNAVDAEGAAAAAAAADGGGGGGALAPHSAWSGATSGSSAHSRIEPSAAKQ